MLTLYLCSYPWLCCCLSRLFCRYALTGDVVALSTAINCTYKVTNDLFVVLYLLSHWWRCCFNRRNLLYLRSYWWLFVDYTGLYFYCLFYVCYLYLFTYTGIHHDFPVRWRSCNLTVTRQTPLVEQELLTPSDLLSSPIAFSGVRVVQSSVFCVVYFDHFCLFVF